MSRRLGVAALALCAVCSGCAVLSVERFGPEIVHGENLNEIIEKNGPPDIIGSNEDFLILGYHRIERIEVLGLFGSVKKTSTGIVLDKFGKLVTKKEAVASGNAITILGVWTSPLDAGKSR